MSTVYTAPTRNTTTFQKTLMDAGELSQRLQVSVTIPFLHAAYMQLKKQEQAKLKDTGLFLAGELRGGRRKSENVQSRWAATLDANRVPGNGTEAVLAAVRGLECGAVIYSTASHSESTPRLRIVIPLDRDATPDEYEALTRKTAQRIDPSMTWFDHTAFKAVQAMYWPAHCEDVTPVYECIEGAPLAVDGTLALYEDWHDLEQWPRAQGESREPSARERKQADPLAKGGIVGAFCNCYTIDRAIAEHLPEIYEPCANSDRRYTYTGGSTAGGAVVYDSGTFLFSHHATDPCSGKLVNAFDMVRHHLYGELDDEAKPGTPAHLLPSYKAMCAHAEGIPEVAAHLAECKLAEMREEFGDVLADEDAGKDLAAYKGELLTCNMVELALQMLGISVRHNLITGKVDIDGLPAVYSAENAANTLPIYLMDILRGLGIKGATKTTIADFLSVICDENRTNPVHEMLTSTKWDGTARLPEVYRILGVKEPRERTYIHKWLLQAVAMAENAFPKPYGAEGVLVLQGPEGIGKTRFFSVLATDSRWFAEGLELDTTDKDSLIKSTSCWIGELGELDSTVKKQQAALKAHITAATDNIRVPYAREAAMRPRRTSYCGTVNPGEFLREEAGSRRFWTIPVQHIDLAALNALSDDWLRQLWAEVYIEWQLDTQGFRLTPQERQELNASNERFKKYLPAELEIRELLDFSLPGEHWQDCYASDLLHRVRERTDAVTVGKILRRIAREQPEIGPRLLDGKSRYRLPIPDGFERPEGGGTSGAAKVEGVG